MTVFVLVTGLALVGVASILFVRAATLSRARTVDALDQIRSYGYAAAAPPGGVEPAALTVLGELATRIGSLVGRRIGPEGEAKLREQLRAAGMYTVEPQRFIGYRMLAVVCVPLVWFLVENGASAAFLVLTVPLFAAGGWYVPPRLIQLRAQRRLRRIEQELPELIDLLVVTVEAGVGFNASLQICSERLKGPLGQELRLTLQEQSMGLGLEDALRNLMRRVNAPAMQSFVRSVLQGQTLGASIGQILRSLAVEMRKRRRAKAEEKAQKAPIKILFPLVFLIFPAMYVVILTPAVYEFLRTFKGF